MSRWSRLLFQQKRLVVCAIFAAVIIPTLFTLYALENAYREIAARKAQEVAEHYARALERSLDHALNASNELSGVVRHHQGRVEDFARLASYIQPRYEGLFALALAPAGVITDIQPQTRPLTFAEDEFRHLFARKAFTHSLKFLPPNKIAFKGPLRLSDGTLGGLGILPVYLPQTSGPAKFWGVTIAAVKLQDALSEVDLDALEKQGYRYAVWGINPLTKAQETVAQSFNITDGLPNLINSQIAGTSLTLGLSSIDPPAHARLLLLSFLASLFCCLVSWSIYAAIEFYHQKQEFKHIALYDGLTGLPNRRLLMIRLQMAIDQASRAKRKVAVAYLDLDGFKLINDRFGHAAGDEVLVKTTSRILDCLRPTDTLARVGGDEFVIVVGNLLNEHEVEDVLRRAIEQTKIPFEFLGERTSVSASIGTAFFDTHGTHINTLLVQADRAMYQAKGRGKSCSVIAPRPKEDSC